MSVVGEENSTWEKLLVERIITLAYPAILINVWQAHVASSVPQGPTPSAMQGRVRGTNASRKGSSLCPEALKAEALHGTQLPLCKRSPRHLLLPQGRGRAHMLSSATGVASLPVGTYSRCWHLQSPACCTYLFPPRAPSSNWKSWEPLKARDEALVAEL